MLPVYPVLGLQQVGKVNVHELRAAREDRARNDLNAALWKFNARWFDATPCAVTIAHEVLDEVFHRPPRNAYYALGNVPGSAGPWPTVYNQLDAQKADVLTHNQEPIGDRALLLIRGLAQCREHRPR